MIDEHFRRSLGKHYASLFKSSDTPSPPQARAEDVTGMSGQSPEVTRGRRRSRAAGGQGGSAKPDGCAGLEQIRFL